ncbi:MAG: glycoside hydrolase family 13 protein [Lachnospiraceae bacterium]|nr:glycoside hydrolase family 13 protein [Lachnospiraceae bacterium]
MDLNINLQTLSKSAKTLIYLDNLTNVFNQQAVFSDGTGNFRIPPEPEPHSDVRIRLRGGRENLSHVYIICDGEKIEMNKFSNDRLFDYYEAVIHVEDETVKYYFEVHSGQIMCFYDAAGISREVRDVYAFSIMPGFKTPDWAKGAVIYQIYVDRFFPGDKNNTVENDEYFYIGDTSVKVTNWDKYPASMGVREFYGGDLQGVMDKLDYLEDLGVDAIYFNPIFVSPSNHKYDSQDYDNIDPHLGKIVKDGGEVLPRDEHGNLMIDHNSPNKDATKYITRVTSKENLKASNDFFAELVRMAHERGIKVILDGVFNHCGSFNKWLDRERIYENAKGYKKGAYVDKESPYNTFFKFREDAWPYNPNYDGWWGHDTLPKLNYEESPELFNYIMKIARKWVSPPYNCDGWRLDVASDLGYSQEFNHFFWKEFRKAVKSANPEAIILAEHYGDPGEWLKGDEWDTVMNYDAFMEPVTWFLTGVEKHSDEFHQDKWGNPETFFGAMRHYMTRFNTQSLLVSMNELSNHDHSRFLTRTNHTVGRVADKGPEAAAYGINKAIMRMAVMIQMTWPGAPTIYYGDEAGVTGWTDPDNRRTYPWGHEDHELINYHRQLIKIHKDYEVFSKGSTVFLYGAYNVIAYGRFDINDEIIVIINNYDHEAEFEIPVWRAGVDNHEKLVRLLLSDDDGYSVESKIYEHTNGMLKITCPKTSGMILKNLRSE